MRDIKLLVILIITIVIQSCKSYVQVFETKSQDSSIVSETNYVYENDSIKVTYTFWSDHGSMGLVIYNKLKKPLYVDWKKSSFIINTIKLNYWEDVTTSNSMEYRQELLSLKKANQVGAKKYYLSNSSAGISTSMTNRPERITFIPPNSNYLRKQFRLYPNDELKIKNYESKKVKSLLRKKRDTEILEKKFNVENTPLLFRNFLTLSYDEQFSKEMYVDNEFYISKVSKLESKEFEIIKRKENSAFFEPDENGELVRVNPYKDGKSFYIELSN